MSCPPNDPRLTAAARLLCGAIDPDAPILDLYGPEGSTVYESATASDTSEIREMLEAVGTTRGPVLELACGGGRLTVPLLSLGRSVCALDLSPRMLDILTDRAARLPRSRAPQLRTVLGDMAHFSVDDRFGAIVVGATSFGLLDSAARRRSFRCMREHLAPDGRIFLTAPDENHRPAGSLSTTVAGSGSGSILVLTDEVSADARTRTVSILEITRRGGSAQARIFVSSVQILDANELLSEAASCGLSLRNSSAVVLPAGPIPGLRIYEYAIS